MADIPVPSADDVKRMLSMMYDGLKVDPGDPVATDGGKCVVAIYISDEDVPLGAVVADYPFAAFTGAALTRIPPGGAEDAAESGDLGESILDNVKEVFNICSRLLMDDSSTHLRLGPVYESYAEVPDAEKAVVEGAASRADFSVDVPNYGTGNVSFLGL